MSKPSFWSTVPGILTALAGLITAVGSLIGALYSAGIIGRHENTPPAAGTAATAESAVVNATSPVPAASAAAFKPLRSLPAILSPGAIDTMLVNHGFYDKTRNSGGRGVVHQYEPRAIGDATIVLDRATGLTWQRGGSEAMRLDDAGRYVERINAERFAGFGDWRLPTLEEAMSLMEPEARGQVHIDPVFTRGVNFIWTADRAADGRGLVVYFYDGMVSSERSEFNARVRAVRSAAAGS
jgi:uncharacterized protein DUF1566